MSTWRVRFALTAAGLLASGFGADLGAAHAVATGTIVGQVHLSGKPPANAIIRMGVDPACAKANARARVYQQTVVTDAAGGLANVFVRLQGTFPPSPVPSAPVAIDQRGCVYAPRVVGARVGQPLEVRNSDSFMHNVHSASAGRNAFNTGQPVAGLVFRHPLKPEPGMLRIGCDIHRWMTTYVGVVDHPFFAVSSTDGRFRIEHVPPGTYALRAWHERYGELTASLRVTPNATTTTNFTYTGQEKPQALP